MGFSGQYGLAARTVRAKITTLEWIRVADPDAGIADDFQFQAGGTRHALQVKWAQYPTTFSWAELVNAPASATSLIGRLAQAWLRIRADWSGPLEIRLWSNENPSSTNPPNTSVLASCSAQSPRHFAAFLARSWMPVRERLRNGGGWSQVASLPEVTEWQPAWEALRDATGLDTDGFARFIGDLDLHFGPAVEDRMLRPDETPRDLDLEHLAATLQALVADPARPVQLSREELFERLGWTSRQRFRNPHAFPVPAVYTANDAARRQLQARFDQLKGGYVALVGPAGAGKSTLLASLTWPERRVVRYYAFVPDAPDPLSGRGEAESFLHDVSLGLEDVGVRRSGYGNDLRTQRTVLLEQLAYAGERWRDRGEVTVIVVDGLDHIPREQSPSRSLLEELPAPTALSDGVFVVLGTQTTGILPQPIRDALSIQNRTVELPPLARDEVLRLADAAGPGGWLLPGQRESLVVASEGHPLALTYLLQDLAALESAESDPQVRTLAVDALLSSTSVHGHEIEARYRGYMRALGEDRELLDVVAAVARLRTPVDLDWLRTWVESPTLEVFVERTATFFRREGTVWRFIHNSFRRFLIEQTSQVAGAPDPERDRQLHVALADTCAGSDERWTLYRDEELAHRYLAGDYSRVLELATPSALRDKLLALRPTAVVRDQARLALRAAAQMDDHVRLFRMLLFQNEIYQREVVISPEQLASVMIDVGPPERALEHVVAAGRLRVPVEAALEIAVDLVRSGSFEAAAQILRAAGSLAEVVRDKPGNAADWAEVTFHISGLEEVLAQLDDQLMVPITKLAPDDPPAELGDQATRSAKRRHRDREQRITQITSARAILLARCFDLLTEIRDDTRLTILRNRIDQESSLGWRGRARAVHAIAAAEDDDISAVLRWSRELIQLHTSGQDDEEDEEDASPTGRTDGIPLSLRLTTADTLIASGLTDAHDVDLLVPPDTVAAWPSAPSGQEGLTPFRTLIDLEKLRAAQSAIGVTSPGAPPAVPPNLRDAGAERFYRALTTLAQLEGRQAAADQGHGIAPNVAAEADPIVRLLEVPSREAANWTSWYYVQSAARDLFRRLAHLAKAGGSDGVSALLDRFAMAWDSPDRVTYWSPQRQLDVLHALLSAGTSDIVDHVSHQLDRLDAAISTLAAGPHDLAEVWLDQARAWSKVGDLQRAEEAVRSALRTSWGPGIYRDDRQLVAWLDWMGTAADAGVLTREEFLSTAQRYAGRLTMAHDTEGDAADAAERLIQMMWPADPALSTALAESLCDMGVIEEGDVIEAVLLGAAQDPAVPAELTAVVAAELHMPLRKQPPHELRLVIEQRPGPQASQAVAIIDDAVAVWSVPEDDDTPSSDSADATAGSEGVADPVPIPVSVTALLTAMRRASRPSDEPRDWAPAVDAVAEDDVTPAVAAALLDEAGRLRLDGEALGGIVAMAARAGQTQTAAEVLGDALARTPAHGWLYYGDGTRLKLLRAALRHRDPTLVRLAASDLAGALSTGAISGQIPSSDLRRILETIAGEDAVGQSWPEVAEHLDVYAPPIREVPGPDEAAVPASTPVEALLRWVARYFGHPVHPRDFGARRALHAGLNLASSEAATVLSESISLGGWQAEAALHTLMTHQPPQATLPTGLADSITAAVYSDDAICRDLGRKLCVQHGLTVPTPPSRSLAGTYNLTLPPLPARAAAELDVRGVPIIDMHDPQQIVAPFDRFLRVAATAAGLPEEAVLYRAADIAIELDMPWLRGGHHAQADRLQTREQHHTYRPWALMAGRRALGIVLAELVDAGALPPDFAASPSDALDLIDGALIHVVPKPLDDTTPAPWRPPTEASYDVRGWCLQTEDAARVYATSAGASPTYVLAESTDWVRLEWEKPEERRTVQTGHKLASMSGVLLPLRKRWEKSGLPADSYPELWDLDWADEQLIVDGWEMHSDPPWHRWLALHPAVGYQLGWTPDPAQLFGWHGDDGTWRARSIRRARGQLSHRPPSQAYCAEGWQVILSESGLVELRQAFGPLRRELAVHRTLPARPRADQPTAETSSHRIALTEPS